MAGKGCEPFSFGFISRMSVYTCSLGFTDLGSKFRM